MNAQQHQTEPSPARPARLFRAAIRSVAILWFGAAAAFLLATWALAPDLMIEQLVIAVASGLISLASLFAGELICRLTSPAASNPISPVIGAVFAGMTLRLGGTVALFLTCRYQMAASEEIIAGSALAWYVTLTSVETIVLARQLWGLTAKPSQSRPLAART